MSEESRHNDLLQELLRQTRLPWYGATALIAAVLLLSLVLAAYLDSVFSRPFEWSVWRGGLQPPVIITYVLVIYPLMQRLWDRAVRALAPLLDLDESSRNDILNSLYARNHRWEWLAVFLGASFWVALSQPWNWVGDWLEIHSLAVQITMFGLLGWLVNGGLTNTRQLTRSDRHRQLDVFNPGCDGTGGAGAVWGSPWPTSGASPFRSPSSPHRVCSNGRPLSSTRSCSPSRS